MAPCRQAGLRLIQHFDEGDAAGGRASRPQPATLRIAVNADSLATWVIPALAEVPDLLVDVVIDDQDVSQDWLRRGGGRASSSWPVAGLRYAALGPLALSGDREPGLYDALAAQGRGSPRHAPRARSDLFRQGPAARAETSAIRAGAGLSGIGWPHIAGVYCRCRIGGPWLGHEPFAAGGGPSHTRHFG